MGHPADCTCFLCPDIQFKFPSQLQPLYLQKRLPPLYNETRLMWKGYLQRLHNRLDWIDQVAEGFPKAKPQDYCLQTVEDCPRQWQKIRQNLALQKSQLEREIGELTFSLSERETQEFTDSENLHLIRAHRRLHSNFAREFDETFRSTAKQTWMSGKLLYEYVPQPPCPTSAPLTPTEDITQAQLWQAVLEDFRIFRTRS